MQQRESESCRMGSRTRGRLLPAEENQEIGNRFVVLAEVANHAHQVHAHHVAAQAEKQGLPETQQTCVAPKHIHADGQNRVAEIFAVKIDRENR